MLERELWSLSWKRDLRRVRRDIAKNSNYRDVSISDIEIRELTKDFENYFQQDIDDSLVSIGSVTEGCDCEGEACTNQVFISYQREFILFSKTNNKWQVSPLYKWQKQYKNLYNQLSQARSAEEEIKLQYEINELIETAPECKDNK